MNTASKVEGVLCPNRLRNKSSNRSVFIKFASDALQLYFFKSYIKDETMFHKCHFLQCLYCFTSAIFSSACIVACMYEI